MNNGDVELINGYWYDDGYLATILIEGVSHTILFGSAEEAAEYVKNKEDELKWYYKTQGERYE